MADPTKTNNIDPLAQLMGNRPKAKTASKERGTVMAAKEKDEGVQKIHAASAKRLAYGNQAIRRKERKDHPDRHQRMSCRRLQG